MIHKSLLIIAAALLSTLTLEPAFASGSMRCGQHVISGGGRHGPGQYEVLMKCGEPTERIGNTWIYESPGQRRRIVRFNDNGMLTRVDSER
jgi:hypothetical protein